MSLIQGTTATTYRYDANGRLATIDGPDGSAVTYIYQANGKLPAVEESRGGLRGGLELVGENTVLIRGLLGGLTKYSYMPAGLVTSVQDSNGAATAFVYDGQYRLCEARLPDGRWVEYRYSPPGSSELTMTVIGHAAAGSK